MYSKQREYAILLVTSDFIRVTNFIYPEMVIRFLADESRGKRENKGNEKYTDTPRCNEIRFERISFSKNQLGKIRQAMGCVIKLAPLPFLFFYQAIKRMRCVEFSTRKKGERRKGK